MSTGIPETALRTLSRELTDLVTKVTSGVVAVKSAPYRVVSGVCIANDLVAVTDHTLKRAGRVPIVLHNGNESTSKILGRVPGLDLAILRAEGVSFTPLPHADASTVKTGALAAVVGLTVDVGPSSSLGVFGAIGGPRRSWRGGGGTLDQFIRLDVNLYPSQSGAAVINMDGELVGLASPALSRHSAMAVPLPTIERISAELLKRGRIRRGYLGVGMQRVGIPASLRSKTGSSAEAGLMMLSVEPNSPADKAGLQLGDILVSLGEQPTPDIDELQHSLLGEVVGSTLAATLIRGGQTVTTEITIGERPSAGNAAKEDGSNEE